MFSKIRQHYQVMEDHSKVTEMPLWMIQNAKKDIFGRFLDLGLLDRLDIAYYDGTKCFSTFGTVTRSWRMILKSQKCIFERPTEAKKKFMTIFSSLGCWIDLLSHILMVLNSFYHWYCYQVMKVHKKNHRNAWFKEQKSRILAIFCSLGCWIDIILHMYQFWISVIITSFI